MRALPILRTLLTAAAALACGLAAARRPVGIAFYDIDRLYDTLPSLFYHDDDYTPDGRYGWNTERYRRKIRHTAAVIDSMALPIVALWGVENEAVVRDLAAACRGDYSYLHRTLNSLDGMDFALLYYGDMFYPERVEEGRRYLYVEGLLERDTVGLVLCARNAWPAGLSATCAASAPTCGSWCWDAPQRSIPRPGGCATHRPAQPAPDGARSAAADAGRCATGYSSTRPSACAAATSTCAAIWLTKRAVTPSQPSPEGSIAAATAIRCRFMRTSSRNSWYFGKVFIYSHSQ